MFIEINPRIFIGILTRTITFSGIYPCTKYPKTDSVVDSEELGVNEKYSYNIT